MPIYEFQCRECHCTEELLQKVSDPLPEVCPSCGGKGTFEKLVSHTSFQLKGGGWYNDLYASPKKESAPAKPEATTTAPAPKADTSTKD